MGCSGSRQSRTNSDVMDMAAIPKDVVQHRPKVASDAANQNSNDVNANQSSQTRANQNGGTNVDEVQTLQYAFQTLVGFSPYSKKVNQDASLLEPVQGVFGVFDGHGEYGHLVSHFVTRQLSQHIQSPASSLESKLRTSLERVADDLKSSGIKCNYSGTTATVLAFSTDMRRIAVANVGDSRCVLAQRLSSGELRALDLSRDHKPDLEMERERILHSGGRVEQLQGPPGSDRGPYRVWLKTAESPGLAMSRSLGDNVAHSVGVISDPEIMVHDTTASDEFIILASDGVWEFISSEAAVKLVAKYIGDVQVAADKLAQKAKRRWKQQEVIIDDITVIILKLPLTY